MNELGELLRKLRGKRSLREVAKMTELSHTYISDLEKGFNHNTKAPINPSPETLKRLSFAYTCSYDELMAKAGYMPEKVEIDTVPEPSPIPPSVKTWLRADTSGLTKEEQKLLAEDLAGYFEFRKNELLKKKKNQ
jgi:transcriptional regulator with XRE-family HTH domain